MDSSQVSRRVTYWLDFGGGDAEYFEHLAEAQAQGKSLFISVDPLLRSHMIEAGRVRSPSQLPANVLRIGAGLGPSHDCVNPFLPFHDGVFQHIVCRFVLHLYLSLTEAFIAEAHRVLVPKGDLTIRVPDYGTAESASTAAFIRETLVEKGFTVTDDRRAGDERCSLWDEIYEGRAYEVKAVKQSGTSG